MQQSIFLVHCERIRNTKWYYLRFSINDQLIDRIKNSPKKQENGIPK